jgi:opacity protein-like surface antigen
MKKKVLFIAAMFLGVETAAIAQEVKKLFDKSKPQEVLIFGTNRSQDGYITGGYMIGEWGLYAGFPYSERNNIINTSNGTVSKQMRFGILKQLNPDKILMGLGVQPTNDGTKLNWFIGYNPLRSKDMRLLLTGNVVGSEFIFGAGLGYKIK